MSPEEFDNRLKSSFQDEHLPPKEHLWVNVSGKLDLQAKKPVWHWLLPLTIVVTAGIVWFAADNSGVSRPETAQSTVQEGIAAVQAEQAAEPGVQNTGKPEVISEKQNETALKTAPDNVPAPRVAMPDRTAGSTSPDLSNYIRNARRAAQVPQNRLPASFAASTGSIDESLNYGPFFKPASYPLFAMNMVAENVEPYPAPLFEKTAAAQPDDKNNRYAEFSNKRWFNIGMGPQMALNALKINNDSQAYIHQYLWDNKRIVTNNGTGFNGFATFGYKFGKNNRFSIETGLNYSVRTEDIKFNESTYDIAARDGNNKIQQYLRLKVFIILGPDTTFYDAVQSFSMVAINKYHIFSIPFRFNSEHKISENTYFSAGIGGGLSMMTASKTVHYDLVHEKQKTGSRQRQFSGSLNAMLSLYTNYNDVGQIGIYTGFQSYLSPWKSNTAQYSIRMSDVQLGILFRKPLNL